MSAFWKYFAETLRWPQLFTPGPLQALTRGLAGHLDATRDDALYLREQFFPARAEGAVLPGHGDSRGITRHPSETDAQFRARVVHAWRWHNLGGKTLGLPEILEFYGWDGVRLENMRHDAPYRWAEFSIGLQTPQNNNYDDILATLGTFVWLVNEYKPARSVLWRIYTDIFDRRPIVLANGPKLGEGWLSYYSGVSVPGLPDGDIVVSFGVRNGYQAEVYAVSPLCASFGAQTRLGFLAPYLDTFTVGRSRISSVFPRNNPFVIGSLFSILWADRQARGRSWSGEWDARSWLDYTGFDRRLPRWRMERRAVSRAQLVPGEGEHLSDVNARLGATLMAVFSNPARLGGFRLSGHDMQREIVRLHELFPEKYGAVAECQIPGQADQSGRFGVAAHRAVSAPYLDRFRLGRSVLGDCTRRNNPFVFDTLYSLLWADGADFGPDAAPDRRLPRWRMERRAVSRAQLVPGDGESLSEINARLGAAFAARVATPQRLGSFRLSAHDCGRETVRLHEMRLEPRSAATVAVAPATPHGGMDSFQDFSTATGPLHNEHWAGNWTGQRVWRGYAAHVNIISEEAF